MKYLKRDIVFILLFQILASILVFIETAHSKENWLCTDTPSQRQGGAIYACGIGVGETETLARLDAFDNSKIEFERICEASADCREHKVVAQPERTTCDHENGTYKCYRLTIFLIEKPEPTKDKKVVEFEPYKYEEKGPILKKGMSKKDVLKYFGEPNDIKKYAILPGEPEHMMLFYEGPLCSSRTFCSLTIYQGKLDSWKDIGPAYTEDLK